MRRPAFDRCRVATCAHELRIASKSGGLVILHTHTRAFRIITAKHELSIETAADTISRERVLPAHLLGTAQKTRQARVPDARSVRMGRLMSQIPNEDPARLARVQDAKWRTIGVRHDWKALLLLLTILSPINSFQGMSLAQTTVCQACKVMYAG